MMELFEQPEISLARVILLSPLAIVRIVALLAHLILLYLVALVLPARMFTQVARPIYRGMLFCCGHIFIKIDNRSTDSLKPQRYVCSHSSWKDGLLMLYYANGVPAVEAATFDAWIIGRILKSMGAIRVDRVNGQSNARAAFAGDLVSKLLVFPEGNTTVPWGLLLYKDGIFAPLKAIRPFALITEAVDMLGDTYGRLYTIFHSLCFLWHDAKIVRMADMAPPEHLEGETDENLARRFARQVQDATAAVLREHWDEVHSVYKTRKQIKEEVNDGADTSTGYQCPEVVQVVVH